MFNNKRNLFFLILIIIIAFPSIFSFFRSGFFQSDDGEWMIIRFSAFHQAFRDGQFPVRFLGRLNYGYGYPVANFLYPGFMYLAEPIHILGFNFVDSIKIIFGFSMLGSAIFIFFWLSKIFDKYPSLVGALFYLYTPYHLFDLYKRGSIGEILALSIIPFILWQIERKSFFWITFGIAFLILAHNTLAFLFLPVVILYVFLKKNKKLDSRKLIYRYICILAISLGLSAFYWLPAIFELPFVRFSSVKVSDISQYFSSLDLIGFSTIVVFLLSIILGVRPLEGSHPYKNKFILLCLFGLLSIFLSLELSSFFWNFLPSSFIQFPFRLLVYLLISVSFLSAFIISQFRGLKRYSISLILILILGVSSFPFLRPDVFFDKGDSFYSTNEGTTTVQDEYLPVWVKNKPINHFKNKVEIVKGEGEVNNLIYNSKKISFDFNSSKDSKIRINTIYYPGWKAFIDEKESIIDYNNEKGVMDLFINKGKHFVELSFSETPLRLFADSLTIFSFIILIIFYVKFRYGINR